MFSDQMLASTHFHLLLERVSVSCLDVSITVKTRLLFFVLLPLTFLPPFPSWKFASSNFRSYDHQYYEGSDSCTILDIMLQVSSLNYTYYKPCHLQAPNSVPESISAKYRLGSF